MAEVELATYLRDLPYKIQESSLKTRREVVHNVTEVLQKPDLQENIIKGICKLLQLTLFRYRDNKSQTLIKKIIESLISKYSEFSIKHLSSVFYDTASLLKNIVATSDTSQSAFYALNWSVLLFLKGFKHNKNVLETEYKQLIKTQVLLYCKIVEHGDQRRISKAYNLVNQVLSNVKDIDIVYLENLKKLEASKDVCVFVSLLFKKLSATGKQDLINANLEHYLDIFVKNFITCKTRPEPNLIKGCYELLSLVTEEQFQKLILPPLQKSMLRNPEIIIQCVGLVVFGIKLDFSKYAMDIGNSLIANLHSKDDNARSESCESLKMLSMQIKDKQAIENLTKKVFDVFNGSDGKLTVAEHKTSVLEGAGNLSNNGVSADVTYDLIVFTSDCFIKVLQTEAHEKMLCHALDMLSVWTAKLNLYPEREIPKKLIEAFKNGFSLKTSTPLVKSYYNKCILSCINEKNCSQFDSVIPFVVKSVEKVATNANNMPIVIEGVSSATVILKIAKSDKASSYQSVFNLTFDMDKQVFFNDKFLTTATDEGLILLMQLCESMFVNHMQRVNVQKSAPILQAILYCVTLAPQSDTRRKCSSILKSTMSSSSGITVSQMLLEQLTLNLRNNDNSTAAVTQHALVNCITTMTSCVDVNKDLRDREKIALECFLPCHSPKITDMNIDLWIKIIKYLKINPQDLIKKNLTYFEKLLIENYAANKINENALATLLRINSSLMMPKLVNKVIINLDDPKLCQISKDEYFTYLTPDGELYDKSVLPKDDSIGLDDMNLKRESKVYSYKDQLEELQLRRELEEKKRKEGKIKEPKYTQKQLEAIKNQKAKESNIKERLKELNVIVTDTMSMLYAAVSGNPFKLSLFFKDLLPVLLKNLQSHIAAQRICDFYVDLRKNVGFQEENFSNLIANVTLRLFEPKCDLNPNFQEENLNSATSRVMSLIHAKTVAKLDDSESQNEDEEKYSTEILPVPTFCYVFPFLKQSMLAGYAKNTTELLENGIDIISEHVRVKDQNDSEDLSKYLPTKQIFELLVEILNTTSGRVQSQCEACLIEVANCVNSSSRTECRDELDTLLSALQSPLVVVRDSALRGLTILAPSFPKYEVDYDYALNLNKRILIALFDVNEENRALASTLWQQNKMSFSKDNIKELLIDIEHPVECIQRSASQALAHLLSPLDIQLNNIKQDAEINDITEKECKIDEDNVKDVENMLKSLMELYKNRLDMIPAKLDGFGREIESAVDLWGPRRGVALGLYQLAPFFRDDMIGDVIKFFIFTSLSDRHEEVRKEMLNAALHVVDLHGKLHLNQIWPIIDQHHTQQQSKQNKNSSNLDIIKQSTILLTGSLARHLPADSPKIATIVMRLIQTLATPSQIVQESIANNLIFLIQHVHDKDTVTGYVNKLTHQLLKGEKYGERKGASYGLAGVIKGLGILSLKQYDIINKLTVAIQDKKNYKQREGALFAFEQLFNFLGKLFEPYIIHIIPLLLICFGDTSNYVREAANDTSKVIMSKLSSHGVKLVLPSLLDALKEDEEDSTSTNWRSKVGTIELLGQTAYCAPKQLSSCLPSVVPRLIEVQNLDSHIKVQESAVKSLKIIGSVIKNPEIQSIVPVLLLALQNPSQNTKKCLETLLSTKYVHYIDTASLSLIMPVIQRSFLDQRSTEIRTMSAKIIANIYSLTDQKDLVPYLGKIVPGLKNSLLDPVPEVRQVSAKALGKIVQKIGENGLENGFEDLLPWLMTVLTSNNSSVDRSGAAQGLSEVLYALGTEKLQKIMPDIIATCERNDISPYVKDGYIMLFIYLPVVFKEDFMVYISQIINPILKALADESEFVRETSLKAGQRIISLYAASAIELLLPELENGLFDNNWRIRYSSVQLLGDLLYRISGVTGKMSTETASEDDNFGTEQQHVAIIDALGVERRNRVLAGLYMGRSDVALMVRQASLHVWKVVVTNTPRTLREILPTLFTLLLGCLASENYDRRQVAARTLGDLVRKLGERVLPEIIPILERGLESPQADQRQGVCIGLSEIMTSTSKEMVLTFVHSLVPTVRKALCDELPEVRKAAAKTFDSLHATVGARALDDILPTLMNQLNDADPEIAERTLDGLRQVMSIKSRVVLPYLIPQLTAPPANTKALSILASVAGESLNKYLPRILPSLQVALASAKGTPEEATQLEYCQAVILSVSDETGIRTIIDTMLDNTKIEDKEQRSAAATLLCRFCANSKAQYQEHIPQLIRGLILLGTEDDTEVLKMAWEALGAIVKGIDPKCQSSYVTDVRQAVKYALSDRKISLIPLFCLPKGVAPILPIFREALLNGDGDEKEMAALGLGDIIKVTNAVGLQTSVVAITGPLIRILGDRFSANVKTAVLETLSILLSKVGVMLKQFLPQLQTTFVKALNDPSRTVRLKSAGALSNLIVIHQRVDPLFTELHNTVKNTEDLAIKETTLHALRGIISQAGDKMSEPIKMTIHSTLVDHFNHSEEIIRKCAAGCLGAVSRYLDDSAFQSTLNQHLLVSYVENADITNVQESRGSALTVLIKEGPEKLWNDSEQYNVPLVKTLLSQLTCSNVVLNKIAIRSCGYLIHYLMVKKEKLPSQIIVPFVKSMNNNSNEVKQLLARVSIYLAKNTPTNEMSPDLVKSLLPALVNGTKEKNSYVKANSEFALIAILKLKEIKDDSVYLNYLNYLDAGAKESLQDVVTKVLKKILTQSEGKEEELDDTLLT